MKGTSSLYYRRALLVTFFAGLFTLGGVLAARSSAAIQEQPAYASREFETPEQSLLMEESAEGTEQNSTISVDDGSYENLVGLAQPGTIFFINRLKPTSYPATLSQAQIYFPSGQSNLAPGLAVTLLAGSNLDGDENISGASYQQSNATIQSLNQFNTYNLPAVTINSGDFLVGFRMTIQANTYPGALDTTPPSRRRSYVSTDGASFELTDNVPTIQSGGNFGIRAVTSQSSGFLSVSPSSLTFNATLNQGNLPSQQFTVTNTGSGFLSFNLTNSDASLVSASPTSGNLGPNQSQPITVFATNPNQAGSRSATLTVNAPGAQNSPQNVAVTVNVSGQGTTLSIDDGLYENVVGLTQPGTISFINRLKPTSYPATLSQIQINFRGGSSNLTPGMPMTLLVGTNPDGDEFINGTSYQQTGASVQSLNQFNQYSVQGPTIQSGDFLVGFRMQIPANVYPAALDTTPPSKRRSYVSTDSTNYVLTEGLASVPAGNLGIRAVVGFTPQTGTLNVSPTFLSFNATPNQGNPPSQQFTVTNTGAGLMTFNIGSSDSSLANASPSGGSLNAGQSQAITVFVTNPNQPGTRTAALTVTAPGAQNSPQTVTVNVTSAAAQAILDVSPSSLLFNTTVNQGNPPPQQLTIRNLAGSSLTFNLSTSDSSLVNFSPSSGTIPGGQQQTVSIFVNNPNQVGTRQAFLTVNAPGAQNSPRTVTVTVNTTSPPAILGVSPTSLTFNAVVNQGNPPSQLITVTNSGSGFMSFTVGSSDSGLVNISPSSGSLNAGQSQSITVFVNNPNQAGTRQAFLTFTAPGAQNSPRTATVTVNTTSPPAILGVSPTSLTFNTVVNQGNPPSQLITVTNCGRGFMIFTVGSSDSGLVNISPASGSLNAGQSQSITVFVNNPNQIGTRQAFLTFSAPGAQNSPQTATVTVNTTSPPAILDVNPSSMSFSTFVGQGSPPSQPLIIRNLGSGSFTYAISSSDTGLVNVSPTGGTVFAGQEQTVFVFVNNPNQPGTRQAFLTVTAPGAQNSPRSVTVTVNTTGGAAVLNVTPSSMTFNAVIGQGNPPSQQLIIQNTGGSQLNFNVTSNNGLITVSPANGTVLGGQTQAVLVTATNPNMLGTTFAQLTVSAPGAQNSPQTVSVSLTTDIGSAQDESEPNNAPASAKSISLTSPSIVLAGNGRPGDSGTTIDQLDDECEIDDRVHDWFRLVVGQRDAYGASLNWQGSDADFNLYLFSQTSDDNNYPEGVQLIDATRFGPGQAESIFVRVLEPGTYFIGVSRVRRDNDSDSVRVNYMLTVTRGTSPEWHAIEDTSCVGVAITNNSTNGQYIVNRVRPTQYPARLERISILFSDANGFPSPDGRSVRIIVFADPSGSGAPPSNPSLLVNQTMVIDVPSNGDGQFNTLNLDSNGPVIFQGDLYVGYVVDTPNGVLLNTGRAFNTSLRSFMSSNGGVSYQVLNRKDNDDRWLNAVIRPALNTRPFGVVPAGDPDTEESQVPANLDLLRPRIIEVNPE
ncbi:MAG: choice-of-anchor D domain-containing protein [Acidobacteria bacterium]|nr:choice-of-anchor D domain-containing protein [Acidobacteriota bacterium]